MHACAARSRLMAEMLRLIEQYFYAYLNVRAYPIEDCLCFLLGLFDDSVSTDTLYVSNDELHNEHDERTW
jgi:hypothetical protein